MNNRTELFQRVVEFSKPFWRKRYLDRYKEIQNNKIAALNLRKSVRKITKEIDAVEFVLFDESLFDKFISATSQTLNTLETLKSRVVEIKDESGNTIQWTVDIVRAYKSLIQAGLSEQVIGEMRISDVIMLDAVLFQAGQDTLNNDLLLDPDRLGLEPEIFTPTFIIKLNFGFELEQFENSCAEHAITNNNDIPSIAISDFFQIISDLNTLISEGIKKEDDYKNLIAVCNHVIAIFNILSKQNDIDTLTQQTIGQLIHGNNCLKFNYACHLLKTITKKNNKDNTEKTNLKNSGKAVCEGAEQLYAQGKISPEELPSYTNDVYGTYDLIKTTSELIAANANLVSITNRKENDPLFARKEHDKKSKVDEIGNKQKAYGNAYIKHSKNIENATPYHKKKFWLGLLLAVGGAAIVAISIITAVATHGASTPLSLLGLKLGGSMLLAGTTAALGFTAFASLGLSIFGMYKLRENYKEEKVSNSMVEVKEQANELELSCKRTN